MFYQLQRCKVLPLQVAVQVGSDLSESEGKTTVHVRWSTFRRETLNSHQHKSIAGLCKASQITTDFSSIYRGLSVEMAKNRTYSSKNMDNDSCKSFVCNLDEPS